MGKLDPTAYDRWWRTRIGKEEATYLPDGSSSKKPASIFKPKLDTLGNARVVSLPEKQLDATDSKQLSKALSEVVGPTGASRSRPSSQAPSLAGSRPACSIAAGKPSKARRDDDVASVASYRSNISYPKTPNFSTVGTAIDSEVLSRLEKLESELKEEQVRRAAAEKEMKELLSRTATPGFNYS